MKASLLPGAMLALAISAHAAPDPSAPLDMTSVPAAELKRGMDAENACLHAGAAPDYARCIFAVEARHQQMAMSYKLFDTGLFFKAWLALDGRANSGGPSDDGAAAQAAAAARQEAASMYTIYRSDQRKVGVTDEQVIAVAGLPASTIASRMAFWDNQLGP